jgi:uncharacterized phiE125 gp8 family phage protein
MSLTLIEDSEFEPVTLEQAKLHCRVDTTKDDELIWSYVQTARRRVETMTKRSLGNETWEWRLDRFPKEFDVPRAPLRSVTSITYIDTDGAEQTLSTSLYTVDVYSIPGRIVKAYNQEWPDTLGHIDDVTVTFESGYATQDDVPPEIQQGVLLIVGDLYENREDSAERTLASIPLSAAQLVMPFQVATL